MSVALFSMSLARHPAEWVATVVAVLILHEGGHLFGMWLFGYRDLRVFFVPFFGAATSGRKETAPAWQEAVVLVLGPVPGIAVGYALASSDLITRSPEVFDLALALVWVNALNLLPLFPLDGGRLFQALFMARRPNLTGWVRLLTAIAFGSCAWNSGSWFLWLVTAFLTVQIPIVAGQARAAADFRRAHPKAARRADELTDAELTELVALGRMPGQTKPRALSWLAEWVRDVHGQAVRDRAGLLAVLMCLGVYAAAGAAAWKARDMLNETTATLAQESVTSPDPD